MSTLQAHTIHSSQRMKSPMHTQFKSVAKPQGKKESVDDRSKKNIHSGQFMVSRLHDKSAGDYLSDEDDDTSPGHKEKTSADGYNFDDARKDTYTTYSFGSKSTQTLAIDASLSRLFEHMTLAYSGKITSPKWKPFRGMHLRVKDKIRLNNIIWREWHMQYVFGKKPLVCHFATPLHDDVHTKPEDLFGDSGTTALLEKVGEIHSTADFPRQQQTSHTDLILNTRDLQDMMDLSDSLFSSLNQPFAFPNPRELSGLGYADFIQPGLVQLQPNLDDFMDLDPLTDMLTGSRSQQILNQTENTQIGQHSRLQHGDVEMALSPQIMTQDQMINSQLSQPSPGPSNRMMVDSPGLTPTAGLSEQDPMIVDTENFILNQLQILQQQKQAEDINRQLQQQRILEMQKKKQQEEQERRQEQEKQEQQLREQQKQQQQQQQRTQLQALLQNQPQIKNILTAMGENAPALLEELSKSLQAQQAQNQPSLSGTTTQTPVLNQSQPKAQVQMQKTNMSQSASQFQRQLSSGNSTLISNLLNSNNQTTQQKPVQSINNTSAKARLSSKFAGNTSILAALTADEKQSALSKMTVQPAIVNNKLKPALSANIPKKDNAGFTIPTVPYRAKVKPRVIAPAPPAPATTTQSTISQQNSYLAQLLTTGTYPGALVNVKEEAALANLQAIQPAPGPASPQGSATQSQSSPVTVSIQTLTPDFPTSVLLAAANHAFSSNSLTVKEVLQNVSLPASPNTSVILASSSQQKPEGVISPAPSPSPTPMFSPTAETSPASVSSPVSSSMDEYHYTLKSPEPSYAEMQPIDRRDDDDSKKTTHLSSEKKRRYNIKTAGQMQKSGFEVLHSLIPSLSSNPNAKVSKAAMLQKTAEYCRKLKTERAQMQKEADILKQEIGSLNQAISMCQQQLPATGVPVTRQRADQMKEMFEEFVKQRTLTNWKFWIFSLIIRNLFDSYNTMVSTASVDELCRSVLAWLDQHCSLPSLRPIAANAMRHLSTTTSILSDPARVPEQAAQAVIKRQKSLSEENNT